jgi:tRNA dimethylallyltransferase
LGPTSAGKTELAVFLARQFNGEIISADSRQVYTGMDLGTGKDLSEYGTGKDRIAHHLIDVVKPNTEYNVAKFKKQATKSIHDILSRGKLPIIAGGTGLYISALVDDYQIPTVKPDKNIRQKLTHLSLEKKLSQLKKLDPKSLDLIDTHNPRRVDRALEICLSGIKFSETRKKNKSDFDFLQIGITLPKEKLDQKIDKRVDVRMKQGMLDEVQDLHKSGVSWKRLESFGLEYRFLSQHLQGKLELNEALDLLKTATHQFAKRQMTWFKRDKRIHWIKSKTEALNLIKKFIQ